MGGAEPASSACATRRAFGRWVWVAPWLPQELVAALIKVLLRFWAASRQALLAARLFQMGKGATSN